MAPLTEQQRARLSTPAPGSEWQGLRTLALAYRDIPYNGSDGGLPCSPQSPSATTVEAEAGVIPPETPAPKPPSDAGLLEDDLVLVALVGLQVLIGGGGVGGLQMRGEWGSHLLSVGASMAPALGD